MGNARLKWQWVLVSSFLLNGLGIEAALAQPIPDETLGEERSQVRGLNSTIDLIEGGATRGRNLFHSFREFNIDAGRGAYFIHQLGIENIFSRVTGETRSEINGVLGIRGFENGAFVGSNANLFLINPNGILFGPSSRLDVGGSFVATTANGIQFGDRGFFSATNPEAPSLLTIDPSAFFFNQLNPAPIENQSGLGLSVLADRNLLLLGGDVNLITTFGTASRIASNGGHVILGGVAEPATIALTQTDGVFSLAIPDNVALADITLANGAVISISDGGSTHLQGGRITLNNSILFGQNTDRISIQANQLILDESSTLQTETLNAENAGDIEIRANDVVEAANGSLIASLNDAETTGDVGNISIETRRFVLRDGSFLFTPTFGSGNGGDITILATDRVEILNGAQLSTNVLSSSSGAGGNILIETGTLSIRYERTDRNVDTIVSSITGGEGNAGNVTIRARDTVEFVDASLSVGSLGEGNGGDVTVETERLRLQDGGNIAADANGGGDAGSITVRAEAIDISGTSPTFFTANNFSDFSSITSRVGANGNGNGGDITLETRRLSLRQGGTISSETQGQGDAGNVTIRATESVEVVGWADISAVREDGLPIRYVLSQISSGVIGESADGRGGRLTIDTERLDVRDGAKVEASVSGGLGSVGGLTVRADEVNLIGFGPRLLNGRLTPAGLFAEIQTGGEGTGGNITVDAQRLRVGNGAQIGASTFNFGDGGDITLRADRIELFGTDGDGFSGGVFTSVGENAVGNGGNVRIEAEQLIAQDGTVVSASTSGQGNAGTLTVRADEIRLLGNSDRSIGGLFTTVNTTATGNGGDLMVQGNRLVIRDGARIAVSTAGQGNAGDLGVRVDDIAISGTDTDGVDSGLFAGVDPLGRGNGGDLIVETDRLRILEGATISATTFGQGNAGNIRINARDSISLAGTNSNFGSSSGIFARTRAGAEGQGGTIRINTNALRISDGATINAQTFNAFSSGDIRINANTVALTSGGQIITSTDGRGRAGDITLNVRDDVTLSGQDSIYRDRLRRFGRNTVNTENAASGLFANTRSNSRGNGGRITVNSTNLTLQDDAIISAQSLGTGTAGDIRLNASEQLQLTDSDIITNAARSSGGDITVNADTPSGLVILRGDSDITTNSLGNGGNITLRGSEIIAFDDSDILARSQDARGGNITLAPFFSNNRALESEPPFDGNDRVDVNADGEVAAGTITTPDTSVVQNSLTELPDTAIDTDTLVANSCVVRSESGDNTFTITGTGGLPIRPGDRPRLPYGTNPVRSIPDETSERSWQPGDAIVEPQGAYQLEDGRWVLSRECS